MNYQTLNLLFRCSKEFTHEKIRGFDLNDTECMICSYIYSHENSSQDNVAVALKTDKSTVGKALAALERKQYVRRIQDPGDKRVKRLSLMAEGQEKIADLIDLHNGWLIKVMQALSPEEQQQFASYCERLLAAAEALTLESKE